jgi:hypothetical protein
MDSHDNAQPRCISVFKRKTLRTPGCSCYGPGLIRLAQAPLWGMQMSPLP